MALQPVPTHAHRIEVLPGILVSSCTFMYPFSLTGRYGNGLQVDRGEGKLPCRVMFLTKCMDAGLRLRGVRKKQATKGATFGALDCFERPMNLDLSMRTTDRTSKWTVELRKHLPRVRSPHSHAVFYKCCLTGARSSGDEIARLLGRNHLPWHLEVAAIVPSVKCYFA